MGSKDIDVEDLSFIEKDEKGELAFWNLNSEGLTKQQQMSLGTSLGLGAVEYITSTGFHLLLGLIISDMKGNIGLVELFFINEFSSFAAHGMGKYVTTIEKMVDGGNNG